MSALSRTLSILLGCGVAWVAILWYRGLVGKVVVVIFRIELQLVLLWRRYHDGYVERSEVART